MIIVKETLKMLQESVKTVVNLFLKSWPNLILLVDTSSNFKSIILSVVLLLLCTGTVSNNFHIYNVTSIPEYLCEPLRKCLKDEDPYVRKTAAVCVAKLHDINASLVEDQGFLDLLRDLLSDSNPMVSNIIWFQCLTFYRCHSVRPG